MTIDWRTQSTRLAVYGVLALVLTACGGRSTVVTQDDSAEYQSARSLPPLKKPNTRDQGGPEAQTVVVADAASPPVEQPVPPSQSVIPVDVQENGQPPAKSDQTKFDASTVVVGEVVQQSNGEVVLSLNAGAEESWQYLRNLLSQSDITVHTRNKSAGRFAVGCDGVDVPRLTDPTVDVERKGRWSIFKRNPESTVYCGLQLVAKKTSSVVTLRDRSGQAVPADLARSFFARLLNPSR